MYAAVSDMRTALGDQLLIQLTDLSGTGAIDQAKLGQALTNASNMIDGYARAGNYAVPLTPVSSLLVKVTMDIALYFLYVNAPPEFVRTNYEDALKWLKGIQAGTVKLDAGSGEAPAADAMVITGDSIVACKRDAMRGF